MKPKFVLRCVPCGTEPASDAVRPRCPACDGPLVIDFDLEPLRGRALASLRDPRLPGLFAWFDLLPLADRARVVSLGEGDTPLLAAPRLGERLGVPGLLLKDETRNPTGSFKDRMLAVGVTRAVELGCPVVAVQSSGNVGAAAAAYAARAGLGARILVPRTAPAEKVLQAQMYGAQVFRIDHDSPADIFDLLEWACGELGWYLVSTAAIYNPFTLEGAKTIAYELAAQTRLELPDWLVVPVGGGGNLGSLWRGFLELHALGLVARLPRLVGVQAAGCAPFVEAVRTGRTAREARGARWPAIRTVSGAIADDVPFDAHLALPAVRDSDGTAVAVSDEETLAASALLAATEGLFVEPAAATTIAALRVLTAERRIRGDERVACLLTGTGLKDPAAARSLVPVPELVPLDRAAFAARARRALSG
jgi:threonine synthase